MNVTKEVVDEQNFPFLYTLRCAIIHPMVLLLTFSFLLTVALYLLGVDYASDLAIRYFDEAYPTQEWLITAVKYSGSLLVTVVPILNTILFLLACDAMARGRENFSRQNLS